MTSRPAAAKDLPREVSVIVVAGGVLAGMTRVARRRGELHPCEHDVFHAIDGLPGALLAPVYVVMQAGSLAAVFVAAAIAWRVAGRRAAATLFGTGFSAWLGAKLVKRRVGRGRPSAHLEAVMVRGPTERGLGFPSGHSAVAFAMSTAVAAQVPRCWRPVLWGVASVVGVSRVYVGAHLPLDVAGGAALGVALGTAGRLVADRT